MKLLILLGFLAFWSGLVFGFLEHLKNTETTVFKERVIQFTLAITMIVFLVVFLQHS